MTESEFNRCIDDTLLEIEERIEEGGAPIDYENVGGILTLLFENDSKIIINRQTPVRQLWVAARSGGYHFNHDPATGKWLRDSDNEELFVILNRDCTEQAGETVTL